MRYVQRKCGAARQLCVLRWESHVGWNMVVDLWAGVAVAMEGMLSHCVFVRESIIDRCASLRRISSAR